MHRIFIHFSGDWHWGCFHILATLNSAAVNTGIHVSFQIRILSGFLPSSGIGTGAFNISSLLHDYLSSCQLAEIAKQEGTQIYVYD